MQFLTTLNSDLKEPHVSMAQAFVLNLDEKVFKASAIVSSH